MSLNQLCQNRSPDIARITELLDGDKEHKLIEEEDEHGVTPLQQAAFRGSVELVRLLIKRGANVNANNHNEGYTTLMFAALSGNCDVVRELLDAGAKTHPVNKVNRTAAEMASFVGLKNVVATIRGHIPRSEFKKFIDPNEGAPNTPNHPENGISVPRLSLEDTESLRMLIMELNVHPIKMVFRLESLETLLCKNVVSVLEHLCEAYYKKHLNEWLSGKLHFIKCIIEQLLLHGAAATIKTWMLARQQDGFKLKLDNFIRQCVRSYPFHDSEVFRQMVMSLAAIPQTPPVTNEGALPMFLGTREPDACNTCWELKAESRCSACKEVSYCDRRCQKLDWSSHKKLCASLKAANVQSTSS